MSEQLAEFKTRLCNAWLRENLCSLGRELTPKETLERDAGGPLDPAPDLRYLRDKHAFARDF